MAGIEEDGERRGRYEIFHRQFGGIKTTLYALREHHLLSATLSQEGHKILISARRNTRVLRTLVYNEQFLKFTRSKRTPVNVDNGQFSVSRGTNSPHCQSLLFTDTGYLRAVYFPCYSHVLIVDIVHCSRNDRFP